MTGTERALLALAGLFGASGVALAAAASHQGLPNAAPAAQMLLAHAPALVAMVAAGRVLPVRRGLVLAAAGLVALGVALFAGSLVLRGLTGWNPLPMAAPAGGIATMAGWAVLALAAVAGPGGRGDRGGELG